MGGGELIAPPQLGEQSLGLHISLLSASLDHSCCLTLSLGFGGPAFIWKRMNEVMSGVVHGPFRDGPRWVQA